MWWPRGRCWRWPPPSRWAVAYPQAVLTSTAVRTLADCAAVLCLGLAVLPWLGGERHRDEVFSRATAALTGAAAV